jgi:tRNA-dihydrouridine synthase A
MPEGSAHRFCVAPMMGCTDRHFRYLLRLLSRHACLYTEMVTTHALLRGDARRHLAFDPVETPLALQLGGSEPEEMARCAALAARWGYSELNINVGCPSERVRSGRFGACLMAEPGRVARCVAAMGEAAPLPVSVKTRIGVDQMDSYEALAGFVSQVAEAGCGSFIVHARKAWLRGLNPRQNREIPPLQYVRVHRLKAAFPELEIVVNGGLESLETVRAQLRRVDGVMLGRAVYANPYLLAQVDGLVYGDPRPPPSRHEALGLYLPYVEAQRARGVPLARMTRHLMGWFQGLPGARSWRRILGEQARRPGSDVSLIAQAAACVDDCGGRARAS